MARARCVWGIYIFAMPLGGNPGTRRWYTWENGKPVRFPTQEMAEVRAAQLRARSAAEPRLYRLAREDRERQNTWLEAAVAQGARVVRVRRARRPNIERMRAIDERRNGEVD
jgi:hypothetical protein